MGECSESAVRMEQTEAVQFPRIVAEITASCSQRHYATGNYTEKSFNFCMCITLNYSCSYLEQCNFILYLIIVCLNSFMNFLCFVIICISLFIFFQYLISVRPLLDDENYKRVERLAKEFEETIAVKLQRYLILKSW